jgi:hypothetical protein
MEPEGLLLVPILSQINVTHITPSYLRFLLIYPSSYWSLSLWLSHQNPICIPHLPH